jgi:hypothetical protein
MMNNYQFIRVKQTKSLENKNGKNSWDVVDIFLPVRKKTLIVVRMTFS